MKIVISGAAALLVVAAGSSYAVSASHASPAPAHRLTLQSYLSKEHLPSVRSLFARRAVSEQTNTTPTPTTTPTATTTPTPTATSTYPDPQPIIQQAVTVLQRIRQTHFVLVTNAEQQGVAKIVLTASGDATCKNVAYRESVVATATQESTNASASARGKFIGIKQALYTKSKSTHNKWVKTTVAKVKGYGLSGDQFLGNPLDCPSASSSSGSGSSGSFEIRDTTNLGPATVQGAAVWHVQFTLIDTSTTDSPPVTWDFFVDQKNSTPYVIQSTVNDTQNKITFSQKQTLSHIGKKVTIAAPKLG